VNHVVTIAWKELSDRFRSGWVIACAFVWLGAILLTSLFGLIQIGQIGLQGYERTVMTLLNLVQYLVPLLALLLGHDLIVSEREERTLSLVFANGVSRTRLLVGKYLGGCLTLVLPLLLGFAIAGVVIGIGSKDGNPLPFLKLTASGLVLGVVFLAIGLLLSTFSRTRVQALVASLLTWCVAVFVFDLVALGLLLNTKAVSANQAIEINCEATHVNAGADIHNAFENPVGNASPQQTARNESHLASWLLINPVDLFRALNLPATLVPRVPPSAASLSICLWLIVALGGSLWQLRRMDV
jgi:Cu-processing system permease protein